MSSLPVSNDFSFLEEFVYQVEVNPSRDRITTTYRIPMRLQIEFNYELMREFFDDVTINGVVFADIHQQSYYEIKTTTKFNGLYRQNPFGSR